MLKLRGFEFESPDDALLELLLGDDTGEAPEHGPAKLGALIHSIEALGRWDGVKLRIGSHVRRAFKDDGLVIAGRAHALIRVAR